MLQVLHRHDKLAPEYLASNLGKWCQFLEHCVTDTVMVYADYDHIINTTNSPTHRHRQTDTDTDKQTQTHCERSAPLLQIQTDIYNNKMLSYRREIAMQGAL